ncbi:MAG: hypothetical protein NC093_10490 [Alistipes sp.]|nr:hypothetical protein [Alistipes sp.]
MKKPGFIASLNRSTRITMATCLFFIMLTCVILLFFVLFPITPSEKIMASIGRENMLNGGGNGNQNAVGVPVVVTTAVGDEEDASGSSVRYTGTTTARTVNIKITTGSGFLWGGRIPTGTFSGDYPTTAAEDPDVPTYDPGVEQPTYPGTGIEYPGYDPTGGEPSTAPGYDPGGGEPTTDPGTGDPPYVDPNPGGEPIVDPNPGGEPSVDPNPGGEPSVDPGTGGGGSSEPSPDPAE